MSDPKVVLHRAADVFLRMTDAGIEAAIGGALSLAYHVAHGRSTQDIDLNVLLPKEEAKAALAVLPPDVPWDETHEQAIARDGQVRIMWPVDTPPAMPLDLFFAEHEFHTVATRRALTVPMVEAEVAILSATDLAVFKALFDRPKDWVDIQSMVDYAPPSLDLEEAASWVAEIVGGDDLRVGQLRSLRPDTSPPPTRFPFTR